MSSGYPNTKDSFSTSHADGVSEVIHAATVNDLADATNKIEAELGVLPKGLWPDVRGRLDAAEYVQTVSYSGDHTLIITDQCRTIVMLSNGTLTIPLHATVPFYYGQAGEPGETWIDVRAGLSTSPAGVVIAATPGVSLYNPYDSFTLVKAAAQVRLLKIGQNAWSVNGDVV